MKYGFTVLFIFFFLGSFSILYPMQPDKDIYLSLKPYISVERQQAFEAIRKNFKVDTARWSSLIHLLSSVHQREAELQKHNQVAAWGEGSKQAIDQQFSLPLHQKIAYKAVIDAFVRRNIQPSELIFALHDDQDKFLLATYDTITDQACTLNPITWEDFEACIATKNFYTRVLITMALNRLKNMNGIKLEILTDHEVGHYTQFDSLTKHLIKELLKKQSMQEDKIEQTQEWQNLIKISEKEADDFALANNPIKIQLHTICNLAPGQWNFDLGTEFLQAHKDN